MTNGDTIDKKPNDGSLIPSSTKKGVKKVRKPPLRKSPFISIDKYNALQDAYYKKQNINAAAEAAHVTFKTAKYYIEGPGKPEAGLVAIKQLWLDVQVEAQEQKQMTLLKFHEEQAKELSEIINTALAELKLIRAETTQRLKRFRDSGGSAIETGATLSAALMSYERGVRLMERFLGAPDATLEHRGEDRYKNWTDDEITEYMTTGKVPEHAR